jgi:aminopeptidase N
MSTDEPFSINTNNLNDKIEWLKQSEDSRVIELKKPLSNDGFILANLDVSGFYRVNYDKQSWDNIAKQLMNNKDVILK